MTRLTTARLSKPKNTSTANCEEAMVTVRQMASPAHSRAMPPLHPVTPIRKRRSELPGVRDGCQPIVLPRAPSQMAKTCAQPRAIPKGVEDEADKHGREEDDEVSQPDLAGEKGKHDYGNDGAEKREQAGEGIVEEPGDVGEPGGDCHRHSPQPG